MFFLFFLFFGFDCPLIFFSTTVRKHMESDHITKEDKETERIKKNAHSRVNTHPKRLEEENKARRRDAVVFLEEDMRTFFNKECLYIKDTSNSRIPLKGHHKTAQSLEEKK